MNILNINTLRVVRNGITILDGIDLSVDEGDILGILGPNGAGKTTLFRAILALEKYDGNVSIFNYTNEDRVKVLPFVGYIPQRFSIDSNFPITVKEYVSTGLTALRYMRKNSDLIRGAGFSSSYSKSDESAVIEALDTVRLIDLKDRRLGVLSGGELQRAMLAKVLVSRPPLLILDEPFTALDAESQTMLYELLKILNDDMHITIVIAAHDLMLLMRLARSIACINKRLYFHGSKDECLSNDLLLKFYSESAMHMHMKEHNMASE
jgi:zinc transport system ATP-binding protein